MLEILKEKFDSLLKRLDIVYTLERIKPCGRIMVKEAEYEDMKRYLMQWKLFVERSDFKVRKLDEGIYTDKGERMSLEDKEKGYYFVYLSRNKNTVKKAKLYEEKGDHIKLGMTLGYPKCCCRFFDKELNNKNNKSMDFLLPALRNSKGAIFPFQTNFAARHFDISLISHFPCSMNCKESMKIAKKNFEIAEEYSIQYSSILSKMLKEPIIYTNNYGVFMLRDAKLKGSILTYSGVMATQENKLTDLLRKHNRINIIDNNHIKIGKEEIKTDNLGVMFFT